MIYGQMKGVLAAGRLVREEDGWKEGWIDGWLEGWMDGSDDGSLPWIQAVF